MVCCSPHRTTQRWEQMQAHLGLNICKVNMCIFCVPPQLKIALVFHIFLLGLVVQGALDEGVANPSVRLRWR